MFDFQSPEARRFIIFVVIMSTMMLLEVIIPHKKGKHSRRQRWPGNFIILMLGTLSLRLIIPLLPYNIALWNEREGRMLAGLDRVPLWLKITATIVILDLWIYLQHLLMHKLPVLRDLHRMHHTDTHVDFTTALRFHPLEILFSAVYKSLLVLFLGLPAAGVLVFEIVLNGSAMFNHANIELPPLLDRILRKVIVTPDFHRIHHSRKLHETNSNYGFFLTWWDFCFSSYTREPEGDRKTFPIGIPGYNEGKIHRVDRLLLEPLIPLFKWKNDGE